MGIFEWLQGAINQIDAQQTKQKSVETQKSLFSKLQACCPDISAPIPNF